MGIRIAIGTSIRIGISTGFGTSTGIGISIGIGVGAIAPAFGVCAAEVGAQAGYPGEFVVGHGVVLIENELAETEDFLGGGGDDGGVDALALGGGVEGDVGVREGADVVQGGQVVEVGGEGFWGGLVVVVS